MKPLQQKLVVGILASLITVSTYICVDKILNWPERAYYIFCHTANGPTFYGTFKELWLRDGHYITEHGPYFPGHRELCQVEEFTIPKGTTLHGNIQPTEEPKPDLGPLS